MRLAAHFNTVPVRLVTRRMTTAEPRVNLSPVERTICSLLDNTCRWIGKADPAIEIDGSIRRFSEIRQPSHSSLACEARIAGGWVRDKLLQRSSHDLDVSLSTVTGHAFAMLLREYLTSEEFRSSSLALEVEKNMPDSSATSMSGIGRIAANPEQSKNLETATARVFGVDLDFVNLRKEVYEGDSRIPTMSFGTPKEDAERRDITINSMFYNVHTCGIEDWTGFGLDDLAHGVVRTPIDPVETFTDDPLRILRCVRFASRYSYSIHQNIVDCLLGTSSGEGVRDELRNGLLRKVSRERFGIEVDKMIQGPDPLRALELIAQLGLYAIVFMPPPPFDQEITTLDGSPMPQFDESMALAAGRILDELLRTDSQLALRIPSDWRDALKENFAEVRRYLWYAVALLPLRGFYIREKKSMSWAGRFTLSTGLKLGTKNTCKPVSHYYEAAAQLSRPKLERFSGGSMSLASTIGLLVRSPDITQPVIFLSLPGVLLFSLIVDLLPYASDLDSASPVFEEYNNFWRFAREKHLEEHAVGKAIIDGKRIMDVLQCEPYLIRFVQPFVYAWQIDHADMLTEQKQGACEQWLASEWAEGRIVPPNERVTDTNKRRRA